MALQPLRDGLHLLELLSDQPDPLAISTAARELGWPKSRLHRILAALVEAGYVRRDADHRYRATPKVLRLASGTMMRHPLRLAALPFLRQACAATGLDATLSVLLGDQGLAIATDSAAGHQAQDPFSSLGRTSHLHAAANGKVLLAWMPLVDQAALLERLPLPRLTPQTITDRARLAAELELVRAQGYAINDRENHPTTLTCAVPVFDGFHRTIAALGLSQRPGTLAIPAVVQVLKATSAALSRSMAFADPGSPSAGEPTPRPPR